VEKRLDLIFYSTDAKESGDRLWEVNQSLGSAHKGEFYRTLQTLSQKLRKPRIGQIIAVLLTASRKDLLDILSIRDLLERARIILILPDRNEDTIKNGLTLVPRFFTYTDSDFSIITAILKKMLSADYAGKGMGVI